MFYRLDENNKPVKIDINNPNDFVHFKDTTLHVKQDNINGFNVSTVFLCLNHRMFGIGEPILFETMIFDKNHKDVLDYQERCCAYDEALKMHAVACEFVREKTKDETI